MMSESSRQQAIDLMIEDLYNKHTRIRIKAKNLHCERELEVLKDELLEYLHKIR